MTHEQRIAAYNSQAEIDKEAQRARAQEAALKAEQERRIREEIELRRREAHYGDLVQCAISPLSIHQSGDKWQVSQGVAAELVRGEAREVQAVTDNYIHSLWMAFDDAGQTLALCKYEPKRNAYGFDFSYGQCAILHTTTKSLHRGLSKALSDNANFKGYARCDLAPTRR